MLEEPGNKIPRREGQALFSLISNPARDDPDESQILVLVVRQELQIA